jgi:hypothetical protein
MRTDEAHVEPPHVEPEWPSKEYFRDVMRRWRQKHPERARKQSHASYKKHKAKVIRRRKLWREEHPVLAARQRRAYHRRFWAERREKVITFLGGKCANPECRWLNEDGTFGCTDARCLQVDHVEGGGNQEVKEIGHYQMWKRVLAGAEGYQLLCANCNWIKKHVNEEKPEVIDDGETDSD